MRFFLPHAKKAEYEEAYKDIVDSVKDQLRMPITDRRIFSLSYMRDKKNWHEQVGQIEQQESRYEILAIFESTPYIIFTRAKNGGQGVTILVNKEEVTGVEDFE